MLITCWTQDCQYESQDHGQVTLEQAEQQVRRFGWAAQTEAFEAGLSENRDVCPPGIGFNDGDALFHLHVGEPGMLGLRVEVPHQKKILGFIPAGCRSYAAPIYDLNQAADMLRLFFTNRQELEAQLRR